jgi:hypothetical protein
VVGNLRNSVAAVSDPTQRFTAAAYAQRYFSLNAAIVVDPRYRFADVQAAVSAAVLSAFGFDARDLGQSVTAAEILALAHTVAGLVSIDIVELLLYTDDPPPADPALEALPAFGARYDAVHDVVLPAELLLINPAALTLTEMKT